MFLPYGTDAPVYHLPIATGAMIAVNVLAFFGVVALGVNLDPDSFAQIFNELTLTYGQGLRPWQWITSNFMHAGVLHLLGNMFCLWAFGLVVEGKIGWWRFLLIYLAAAERELLQIISGLQDRKRWSESVPAMVEYIGNFSDRQTTVRLKLAQILVQLEHRPRQALNILDKLHEPLLTSKQADPLRRLKTAAEAAQDKDPLEVVEDW